MNKLEFKDVVEKTYLDFLNETKFFDVKDCQTTAIIQSMLSSEEIKELVKHSRKVMFEKQKQYSTDLDVLHNFRVGSSRSGEKMSRVAYFFQLKHTISIHDIYIDFLGSRKRIKNLNLWFEKFGDWLNYEALIQACKIEEGK